MSGTAADVISRALLNINSYSPGEPLSSIDATVGLNALNDLLSSLSNDEAFVYTQTETIFTWIAGQFQYSVGNPTSPNTFVGTVTGGSNVITGVTAIPSDLAVGATVTDLGGVIPQGTTLSPVANLVTAIGTNTVTFTTNATATPTNPDTITYTVPGQIPMGRPLRFRSGFTRANTSGNANLDYAFEFVSFDRYKEELLKNVQGPWPYIAAYQPTFPYGTLYVYPAPGSNYTAHIFADLILSDFASTTTYYQLPHGYKRALIKLLALELAPIYNKPVSAELRMQAREAKELIKGTNATPVTALRYDAAITRSQTQDAGWIMSGGFR